MRSWIARPSIFHSAASGLSRVPRHAVHSVYARYFDSSTRICILYALLSSHLKKRRTPYQVPGQDFFQLCHASSPSRTQCLSFSLKFFQGVSKEIPRFLAYFSRSSWHSLKLAVCQVRIAPCFRVRASLGTTRPKSTPMTRPNPRQVSHAPIGELNENIAGSGSA